jgi:PAS domain S-box-containing protein
VSPVKDATGASIGMSVVARDITEAKSNEKALADERRRLRDAQAIGHVGSWERDLSTNTMTWSDTLFDLYGLEPGAMQGEYLAELDAVHPDDRDVLDAAMTACVDSGTPIHVLFRRTRQNDGELRWFDLLGSPLYEQDRLVRIGGAVADVTDRIVAAGELEHARDLAIEASQQKSSFLATMSHEIRTPMHAVIGMTDLLLATALDGEQRDFTETVRESGDILLGIINDILDFSKIEAGELELDAHPFDLRECVEGALNLMSASKAANGLELVADVDGTCPDLVVGDVTRFRQVVMNLLNNAVKFTATGEVVVSVSADEPAPNIGRSVRLQVKVRDTGIGISVDQLHRLFSSFRQVDPSTTRLYGGTGLGLTISRRLAEAMCGTIEVTSQPGVGSEFTFSAVLGRGVEHRVPSQRPLINALRDKLVLVVEQHTTTRMVLKSLLHEWGMSCTAVASRAAAIKEVSERHTFDVALLGMPMADVVGEGLPGALRQLRSRGDLPLIMLSDRHLQGHRENQALFAASVTKPIRSSLLHETLMTILAPLKAPIRANETNGARPRNDTDLRAIPLRILLAEDNVVNQKVAQIMISKLGHDVVTVSNGLEAVKAVRTATFDLVLMDMQMPMLDGLGATAMIRSELGVEGQLPIVGVTASASGEDRAACINSGMEDVLAKPFRIESLRSVINTYADSRRPSANRDARLVKIDTASQGERRPSSRSLGKGHFSR